MLLDFLKYYLDRNILNSPPLRSALDGNAKTLALRISIKSKKHPIFLFFIIDININVDTYILVVSIYLIH